MSSIEKIKAGDEKERKLLLDKVKDVFSVLRERYFFLEKMGILENSLKEQLNSIFDFTISSYDKNNTQTFGEFFLENVEQFFSKIIEESIKKDEKLFFYLWKSIDKKMPLAKRILSFTSLLDSLKIEPDIDSYLSLLTREKLFSNPNTLSIIEGISSVESSNFDTLVSALQVVKSSSKNESSSHSFYNLNSYDELYDSDDNLISKSSVQLFFDSIYAYPMLSPDENSKLLVCAKAGDKEAKDLFVSSNLRLVVSIAKNYYHPSLSFLDLVQEGTFGLMHAIEKYDFKRGFQFSTYATFWIRQAISRSIAITADLIRKPTQEWEKNNKLVKVQTELSLRLQRDPTPKEIAEEIHLPVKDVIDSLERSQMVTSLNVCVGENEDTELIELLDSENQDIQNLEKQVLYEYLDFIMKTKLKPREYKILKCIYYDELTLEQTAVKFEITQERIRQLRAKAIHLLQADPRLEEFAECMDNPEEALTFLYLSRDTKNSTSYSLKSTYTEEEYEIAKERAKKKLKNMNTPGSVSNLKVYPSASSLNMNLKKKFPTLVQLGFSFEREDVKKVISSFSDLDRFIIQLFLGYRDGKMYNAKEISNIVGLEISVIMEKKKKCISEIEKVLVEYLDSPKRMIKKE